MHSLRTIIRANAMFSEVSGAVLLAGAGLGNQTFGVDGWLMAFVGASLIAYGALLWLLTRRPDIRPPAQLASIMDVGWVIVAAVVLIGFPDAMTLAGRVALVIVSLIVAGFAVQQIRGQCRHNADQADQAMAVGA